MKTIYISIILSFFSGSKFLAQADSAQFFLRSKLPALERINKCMGSALKTGSVEICVTYFNKLTALPEIGQNPDLFCIASNKIAEIVGEAGDLKEALKYTKLGIDNGENKITDTLASFSYYSLSYFYFSVGEYEPAVNNCLKSIEIAEKANKTYLIGSGFNMLGLIFSEKTPPDLKKALEYYLLSEKYIIPMNKPRSSGLVYIRIGNVLSMLNRLDEAEKYLEKAQRIGDSAKLVVIQKWAIDTYGKLLIKKGNTKKALEMLLRSYQLSMNITDHIGLASTSHELSLLYQQFGDYKNAGKYSDSSIIYSKRIGQLITLQAANKVRSEIYETKGDYKLALLYYKNHKNILDSISKGENLKNMNELEQKFKSQKQEKELIEKEKELVQQRSDIEQQKVARNYFIGGILVLTLFLIIVYRGFKNKQKASRVLAEKNQQIEEKNKEIMDSISYAKRIQSAILPPHKLVKEFLPNSFILYKPKDIVAGDFYWMVQTKETILFAAADCTGHGVPGAMVSVVCNNALNRSVREYGILDPGEILNKTREIIIQEFEKSEEDVKDGMDISICALNLSSGELKWAGANNPIWIFKNSSSDISALNIEENLTELKPNKQPIGKYAQSEPFKTHTLNLKSGETFYIFTDGYQDQFGGDKGKKFKTAKLKELLSSIQHEDMETQREIIDKTFEKWKGKLEQVDDVCFIGVRM